MLTQIFMYEGSQVRTVTKDNETWFVLKDLCDVLDLGNPSQVKTRLDDGVISNEVVLDSLGRPQNTVIVNEDGMYDVILESRKQEARTFRKWVTGDVLTSIRKTGTYSITPQQALPQSWAETLRLLADEMESKALVVAENKQLSIESAEQKQKLIEQETPVAIYNLAIAAHNTMSMQEIAKSLGTGRTKLYNILREEKIVMQNSTMPYQRFLDGGYFKVTERPRASGDTIINDPATRVTAKGFEYIAKIIQRRASNS